ncbi:DUF3048 domain-containing protein [Serpentinicella sp. ANB-PHB4]|uniref:DUF3048 domain-containing protein n=1 Tax=Serpentinicella sp. ANB-PHB4 TaxID=3074076 RepID=UPI0028619566|nr:DUF3048 domain-containing protein [Serpentinicella sp. ANB-PHB4]MDR5658848.1 DUF3048 domain-containing protein [Serpentinicella sp. ANB-PHB4]
MRRLITGLVLGTLFLVSVVGGMNSLVYANPDYPDQDADQIREEIAEYEETIKLLNEDIDNRLNRITELEKELVTIERKQKQAEKLLAEAQARLDDTTEKFSGRVRSAYMKGGASYLQILLESENFGDLIVRLNYMRRIADRDAELISSVREEQKNAQQHQLAIQEQRDNIQDRLFQMETERQNLEDQRKTLNALLDTSRENLAEKLNEIPQRHQNPVYGIAIDNHPNARPQHGLSQASIVYEYEVEGRATRYLALFSNLPNKVGPIRSAREHNTILAWENKVNFITASGSRDNLQRISDWGVSYTNALAHSGFYRDSSRRAPHNLYVNLSTLNRGTHSPGSVIRPGNVSRQGKQGNSLAIEYSRNYKVSYQYDRGEGAYRRLINGNAHRDATGAPILARNVVVQYTDHPTDRRGRTTPTVVGQGTIDYYANGQQFTGTWKKDTPSSPTRFYYEDGQEIEMIYGSTWIQIARPK